MKGSAAPPPSLLARLSGGLLASVLGVFVVVTLTVVVEVVYSPRPIPEPVVAEPVIAPPPAPVATAARELAVPRLDTIPPSGIGPAVAPLPVAAAPPPSVHFTKKSAKHHAPARREARSRPARAAAVQASAPEAPAAEPLPAVTAPALAAPEEKTDIAPPGAWQPPEKRPIDPTNPYGNPNSGERQ